MRKQKGGRIRKRYIALYLYMILVLLSLLTVASYTWFSLSQTPRVSDLYMFVNTQSGLEISLTPDAEEWELQLDFRDMVDVTTPLRPVTWSENEQRFYAAIYGIDGRMTGQWEPLNDQRNANKDNADGYYIKATFYARSGQAVAVDLSPAVEVDKGIQGSGTYLIGYPEWNSTDIVHYNGGQGGECAVRVGFRITPVDETGQSLEEPSNFIIYEPNSDIHNDGSTGYVPTPSIDGRAALVDSENLILQTSSTWTEADPVQRDVVIHDLGEFTTDTRLFELEAGEIVQVDLYIWLEGQDVDCTNQIEQAQVLASIQFTTDIGEQSGMVPIDYPDDPDRGDDPYDRDDPDHRDGPDNQNESHDVNEPMDRNEPDGPYGQDQH